jgi:hypothetical protein
MSGWVHHCATNECSHEEWLLFRPASSRTLDGFEENGEATMNHLRRSSLPVKDARERRSRTIFGLAILAGALAAVGSASAKPDVPHKPAIGAHAPGGPAASGHHAGPLGGPHGLGKPGPGMHGHGEGMAGMPGHFHGHGFAGMPGFGPHHQGGFGPGGMRPSPEQRKARLAELKQKESTGKLTQEEKAELERMERVQAAHEALANRAKEMAENRKNRSRDAKRQALKEFPKLEQDAAATAEYKKHAERLAKLDRAKELASADQNNDTVQKIDALITQENQRHQTWLANHQSTAPGAGATGAHP